MQFRIYSDDYGNHIRLSLFGFNFFAKAFKDYNVAKAVGIRNHCPDGARLVFIDFDMHTIKMVEDEIKYIQERFKLSDFYIFKSSQRESGFHAICLDKLPYHLFMRVMSCVSCDDYYRSMPVSNDFHSWVLRVSKKRDSIKPKFVKTIKSNYSLRNRSQAHALYLIRAHHIYIRKGGPYDGNMLLPIVKYATLNYIDLSKSKNIKPN